MHWGVAQFCVNIQPFVSEDMIVEDDGSIFSSWLVRGRRKRRPSSPSCSCPGRQGGSSSGLLACEDSSAISPSSSCLLVGWLEWGWRGGQVLEVEEDRCWRWRRMAIVLPFRVESETYHYHSAQGVNLAKSQHEHSFLSWSLLYTCLPS